MSTPRKILITSALPYVNGPIHLGHLLEVVQTDIWARFQRMRGHDCYYVCASDAHGTPVMLRARSEGMEPAAMAQQFGEEHQRDFADFLISFDFYHSTHSPENERLVGQIFQALEAGEHIARRNVRQAYDEQEQMFLPDRFVKGTCPVCKTPDQYGDSCENCSATYTPAELIDPVSVISGTPTVERDSEHLFFRLEHFADAVKAWLDTGAVAREVRAKLDEWLDGELRDWDISRDAPYFGFQIPGHPNKFFYVWLDAPVGYMASFTALCEREGLTFEDWWGADSEAELHHFIGKDIFYFHCLFWPAVLQGSGHRLPTNVHVHGFVNVNGEKMSKRRGTFVRARTYIEHLNPEWLRYFYAARLGPGIDDIDLAFDDFVARVNSDLVGKFVNIASRCAGFITKRFDGRLADALPDEALYASFIEGSESIAEAYEQREFGRAMREIMAFADRANQYVDHHKPWVLAKEPDRLDEVQAICTQGLNLFRVLLVWLKPVLPAVAEKAEAFLQVDPLSWDDAGTPLLGTQIAPFKALMTRVDAAAVEQMLEAGREPPAA
ncbi:MAG: methionine--tRNA ligase [Pseudomonadota bacterium]